MVNKETKVYGLLFGMLILIIIIDNLNLKMGKNELTQKPDWVGRYSLLVSNENITGEVLAETEYYDITNPLVQLKINQVMAASDNVKEYIANAAEKVFIDISYNYGATDSECITGTASQNFINGKGDCTEQGMALIALLRGAGIPARAVGGCLYRDRSARCDLFSAIPMKQPRYTEITQEDFDKGIFSRKQGIGSREGGLHLFIEVWIPKDEIGNSMVLDESRYTHNGAWIVVEPTTGEIVHEDSCYLYDEELVVPDDRKDIFCTSNNVSYAISCSQR